MFARSLSVVSRSAFAVPAVRGYSVAAAVGGQVTLPELGYAYDALEPYVSGEIMNIHHSKHHQTYVTNANLALKKHAEAEANGDVATMIGLHGAIKFNGGGHVNHSLFWKNLAPKSAGGGDVSKAPQLSAAINAKVTNKGIHCLFVAD
jgi:Fe-Mn family superoxide dismutase